MMRVLRDLGPALKLWWAAMIGWCRRARVELGRRRPKDGRFGRRIAVREGRAFRRELLHTDDLVGRLQNELRQIS